MIKVTIFNEFYHEQAEEHVREVYPKGIHGAIADFLACDEVQVRLAPLYDENLQPTPDCNLSEAVLQDTDVLMWWGHMRHQTVPDEVVNRVCDHVQRGMGIIFLHSGHHSKPFKKLMGTTCNLKWREGAKERIWIINPAHPIMEGVDCEYFDLEKEEMYGERFDIPAPEELLAIGCYGTHEIFRSACTWQRGFGKIFYLQPGHETNRAYYNPYIQKILQNAVRWAKPTYRVDSIPCPQYPAQPLE